jgi:hypothetical protein
MSTWGEFYNHIRDPAWPNCDTEAEFATLPQAIQDECVHQFGYVPGSFKNKSKLINRVFPIKTATACQLKWTWSTLYLTTGKTASCHRTNHHRFNVDQFDFHNTPTKIQDRERMLSGLWPESGCDYCSNIEAAGGASDRITNLDFPGIHTPPELEQNLTATHVTPRMLEVYFDNVCNLKCVYCSSQFSTLWDAENRRAGQPGFIKDINFESNKQRLFSWLKHNANQLTVFNILGGEPLFQPELEQCLDLFEQYPAPELKLQIFTNLNAKLSYVQHVVQRVRDLIDRGCLREFEVTASLDCWGPEQEYARFPLDLRVWERNFEYLLDQPWINLIINSTVTPLTIKTLPDLLTRINKWSETRTIYHYQNSVNGPPHFKIDIFGDIFREDFERCLALKPEATPEQRASKLYLAGIAAQSGAGGVDIKLITRLFNFLNTLDQRRGTDWTSTFPWLVSAFAAHGLTP